MLTEILGSGAYLRQATGESFYKTSAYSVAGNQLR